MHLFARRVLSKPSPARKISTRAGSSSQASRKYAGGALLVGAG